MRINFKIYDTALIRLFKDYLRANEIHYDVKCLSKKSIVSFLI